MIDRNNVEIDYHIDFFGYFKIKPIQPFMAAGKVSVFEFSNLKIIIIKHPHCILYLLNLDITCQETWLEPLAKNFHGLKSKIEEQKLFIFF